MRLSFLYQKKEVATKVTTSVDLSCNSYQLALITVKL